MGIFGSAPQMSSPPPPPPLPPAANPATMASGEVQAAAAKSRARSAAAAGSGFNGTDLTKPGGTGAGPTAKANLLGETAS